MLHGKLCGNHIYIQYLDLNSTKPNINPAAQNFFTCLAISDLEFLTAITFTVSKGVSA